MEYRVIRSEDRSDAAIEHALFGGRQKGAQNKNHKYIARAWLEGKWRYAYTQAELKILQNWGKNRGSLAGKQKENQLKREAKAAQKQVTKAEKDAKKVVQDTKKAASNAVTKAKGTANVLAGNARKAADTVSNKAGKAVYDTKKAAKELGEDLRSGVTVKQAKIKTETALNDAKNLPKWAKEDATKAANKVKEAASSAEAKGKQLLDKVTSKAKDFKNYSSDVNKRNADAAKELRDTKLASKAYEKTSKEYEAERDQAKSDKKYLKALGDDMKAHKTHAIAQELKKQGFDAQDKYDAIQEEKKSLKYKMSDLVANGKDSRLVREGKSKASSIANAVSSKANEASEKGKAAIDKIRSKAANKVDETKHKIKETAENIESKANKAEEKLDSAKNKVEQSVNKVRNKALDAVDQAKTNAEEKSLHREAEKEYNKEMARRKLNETKDKAEEAIDSVKNKVEQTVNKVRNKALDTADEAKIKAETRALEKEADKAYKEEMAKRENAKSSESSTSKAEDRGKELLDRIINKANDIKNKVTEAVNKAKEGKKEDTKESESQTTKEQEKADTSKTDQAKKEPKEEAKETTTQTSNKNEDYDKVDEMGNKILGGKYGHVGHYDQVKRLMDDGYSKEEAELYATYAEKADKLKRSMTADEYKEFKADYDKKRNSEYGKVDEMGSDIRGGKYGNESHDEQVRRMVNDGYSKEEAEYYATYAEAAHKLHRSMTESEYNAFKKDYEAKNGGAIAKISNTNNTSTSSKSPGSRLLQVDDATEQKLYSENPSYQKASDRASYLGSYIDRIDANGGPKTDEAKENYNKMKRELFSLENKINAFRHNAKSKNK